MDTRANKGRWKMTAAEKIASKSKSKMRLNHSVEMNVRILIGAASKAGCSRQDARAMADEFRAIVTKMMGE